MTPIFITIRVTTTGNENLQHCGSRCKKQNLYLTEGVGGGGGGGEERISLRFGP